MTKRRPPSRRQMQTPSSPFPLVADWELRSRKQNNLPKARPPKAGTQRARRHSLAACSLPAWREGWWRADGPRWSPPSSRSSALPHAPRRCARSALFSSTFKTRGTESHLLAPLTSQPPLPPSDPSSSLLGVFTWEYYPKPEMRASDQERWIRGMTLIRRMRTTRALALDFTKLLTSNHF